MPLTAAIATGWAAVAVLAPLVSVSILAWVADSRSTAPATDALRLALDVWLVSHAVPLALEKGSFGLAPLAITAFSCWQLVRAGATTARAAGSRTFADCLKVSAAVAVCYAAFGAGAATGGQLPGVAARPWQAAAIFAGFACALAGFGAITGTEYGQRLLTRAPRLFADVCRASMVALSVLLIAAAALVVVMMLLSAGRMSDAIDGYSLGVVGGAGLFLLCVVYLPNLVTWSAAYVVGPGFFLGTDSLVSAQQVTVMSTPAFPLFAAVPTTQANVAAALLLLIPPLAGIAAGVVLSVRRSSATSGSVLFGSVLIGVLSGALLGGVSLLASGAAGAGAMAKFGPVAWQIALLSAGSIAAGSLLGASVHRWVMPWVLRLLPGPVAEAPMDEYALTGRPRP
ncbi:MAG: cell division protein PerM, partial [Pseudonocardiaceae bacterium]